MITVTAAIIEKNGLFLAAKRKKGSIHEGYWEFPGGKLEEGETPEECLKRELFEEFGISSTIQSFLGESDFVYERGPIKLLGYFAAPTSGEFELREHDEIIWLPFNELKKLRWAPADIALVNKLVEGQILKKSILYYEENAQQYIDETLSCDMTDIQDKFLRCIPDHGHILDVGCGSGRDSKSFINHGYTVTSIDASSRIASLASEIIGKEVHVLRVENIQAIQQYHGVWACASLLHLPKSILPSTLKKLAEALIPGGILYISVKKGTAERWDAKNRFFNDYTAEKLYQITNNIEILSNTEIIETSSMLRGTQQTWLNLYSFRKDI